MFKRRKQAEPAETAVDSSINRAAATAAAIERKIELDKLRKSGALSDADYETALQELKGELRTYDAP